jgi:transcriptional regulator with XRE-family HTH domain
MQDVLTDEQLRHNLSANLAKVLEERDLTQSDLARIIQEKGENLQTARMRAHRYVNGLVTPEPARLANLAELLAVTVDWLISAPTRKKSRHAG